MIFLLGILLGGGCATVPERNPVPEALSAEAEIPGIPRARMWGDAAPGYWDTWQKASASELEVRFAGVMGRPHHYLALSGGGPLGAFGAGLLAGWTEKGDRPEFTVVTGISAGGLIAPFAFLGSAYDERLERLFTEHDTDDIIRQRSLLGMLWSDSATDSRPLQALIAAYVNQEVVDAIAVEHRKGRRLLIGTTNLDAERPVVWNIGEIADSGAPGALELIQKIVLASSSIPGAFPTVRIPVEADGAPYDELHVDGGTTSMVFVYPTGMEWDKVIAKLNVVGEPKLYVIQNFFVDPRWREVKPRIGPVAAYAMYTMIRNLGIGDLYRIYESAQRDGLDFNLAHIPADFCEKPEEIFDRAFMRKLYDLGYQLGREGYPWKKTPPGL